MLFQKPTTDSLIKGQCDRWYKFKNRLLDHMCLIGDGSKFHSKAMDVFKKQKQLLSRSTLVSKNLMRAMITDVQMGAATRHFETLVAFLATCGADVGDICHGR